MFTRLLVGLDGSLASRAALAQAVAIGGKVPSILVLAHVDAPELSSAPLGNRSGENWPSDPGVMSREQSYTSPLVESAAQSARASGLEVETVCRRGHPVHEMHELSAAADAIFVGRCDGEDDGDLLGSTARELIRNTPIPVVICGPTCSPADRCAVLYDGEASSTRALSLAARYAGVTGAAVEVLYAGDGVESGRELLAKAAAALSEEPLRFETHRERNGEPLAVLAAIRRLGCNAVFTGAVRRENRNFVSPHTAAILRATDLPVLVQP